MSHDISFGSYKIILVMLFAPPAWCARVHRPSAPQLRQSLMLWLQLLAIHRSGVDLLSSNRWGQTGLHHAAALGHRRIVKYLIEQGRHALSINNSCWISSCS